MKRISNNSKRPLADHMQQKMTQIRKRGTNEMVPGSGIHVGRLGRNQDAMYNDRLQGRAGFKERNPELSARGHSQRLDLEKITKRGKIIQKAYVRGPRIPVTRIV